MAKIGRNIGLVWRYGKWTIPSDGYTHPVESRDDLVRHGYLLPQ